MKSISFVLAAGLSLVGTLTFTACLDTSNSFQNDALVYAPVGSGSDAHVQILRANCLNCHSAGETAPNINVSDDVLISSGLVTPGDAENSVIILKVEGLQGNIMPKPPYSPLSGEEIQSLKDWINGLPQ